VTEMTLDFRMTLKILVCQSGLILEYNYCVTTKTVTVTGVLGVSSIVYTCNVHVSERHDFTTPIGLVLYGFVSINVSGQFGKTDQFGKSITFHFTNDYVYGR
jgi:hypothetical protein